MPGSSDFSRRLARCQELSEMTVSDLSRWFDRPRATVNTWLNLGRSPWGPQAKLAEKRLQLLERSVRGRKARYPIPADLTWQERQQYVRGMRDAAERDYFVPEVRAAG